MRNFGQKTVASLLKLTRARATTTDSFTFHSLPKALFSLIRLLFMAANERRVWVGTSWNRSVIFLETLRRISEVLMSG